MSRNPSKTVYIGNLDEKVNERVLYEILVQVGRIVDLHIPRDKETNRHKGYAFAEYETEEIAEYAVRLFSGLVRLHNKSVKFAISGQDKSSSIGGVSAIAKSNSSTLPKPPQVQAHDMRALQEPAWSTADHRFSGNDTHVSLRYPPGTGNGGYEYSRRIFGSMVNNVKQPSGLHPIPYSSY